MPDNPAPARRWFQFRLSTWFVLVAILAWAMWIAQEFDPDFSIYQSTPPPVYNSFTMNASYERAGGKAFEFFLIADDPDRLLYPAVALAAFVGWKSAWLIVERRRKRAAADPI